jgi:putative ABC transport system permease protein
MRFAGALVVRRRARRDLLLLVGWTALIGVTALLAVAAPRLLVDTVDSGARSAVAAAGDSADVVVSSVVGKATPLVPVATPQRFLDIFNTIASRLPPGLKATYSSSVLTVLGQSVSISKIGGTRVDGASLQLAMLTPAQIPRMVLVSGRLPSASATDAVVVSAAAAKADGLHVGSVLTLGQPSSSGGSSSSKNTLTVAAIVTPRNAFEPLWRELTGVWSPSGEAITVLAPPSVLKDSAGFFPGPFQGDIRIRLDPQRFTADREQQVSTEVTALQANDNSLDRDIGAPLGTQSGFVAALSAFPPEERASVAQISLLIAGLLGVAATVVVLVCYLLVVRRTNEIALERARGSSLVGFGLRAFGESVVATIVGGLVGIGVARLFLPDVLSDPAPLVLVLAIAALAPVVQTVGLARAVWRGKRDPANRPERVAILQRARTRRFVIEGAILVLAIAAVSSVRTRGLLETRTDGIDPLLAAAPLLLAVVITLLVLRVYPLVVRGAARFGRRSRGPLGVLGAMQAQRALAVLPLLALTLAVALAVGGGLLIDTVHTGQIDASWQRIGADVRVDSSIPPADAAKVARAPGVTAAGSESAVAEQSLVGGATSAFATVLAVDRGYAKVVGQLPADAGGGAVPAAALRKLAASSASSEPLPIVVDRALSHHLATKKLTLRYGSAVLEVRVVGVVDSGPVGYQSGPFVFVDLASLSSRLGRPVGATSLLAIGPGSQRAVDTLSIPKDRILTRTAWVAGRQHRALVSGVNRILILSAASVALLAVLALLATVLGSARARARSLALLRTLGMRSRLGWWLALAELAPVVLAALVGGTVAGVGIVELLAPSLGLSLLSGGLTAPVPSLSLVVILGVAGGAMLLLGVAMLAEVVAHRRDRLSEVLRVGESG